VPPLLPSPVSATMTERAIPSSAAALADILRRVEAPAVAVSGGVDSVTLATLCHLVRALDAQMVHAVSPAVPAAATTRVKEEAQRQGWRLAIIDAGEFADPAYRANPANRCFFCKTNLYAAIAAAGHHGILSGTNLDDLDDVRPGLEAAKAHGVCHPFVEAGYGKNAVRALARELGLGEVAELPASPCLSSRIETGRWIEPRELQAVERIETLLRAETSASTVRCRIRTGQVVIELAPFDAALSSSVEALRPAIDAALGDAGLSLPLAFAPYRRGSAFLDGRTDVAP